MGESLSLRSSSGQTRNRPNHRGIPARGARAPRAAHRGSAGRQAGQLQRQPTPISALTATPQLLGGRCGTQFQRIKQQPPPASLAPLLGLLQLTPGTVWLQSTARAPLLGGCRPFLLTQRLPFSSSEENLFLCTIQVRSRGKNPHSAATSQTRGCEPITARHLTARTDSAAPSTQDVMEHTLALSPAAVPFQNR